MQSTVKCGKYFPLNAKESVKWCFSEFVSCDVLYGVEKTSYFFLFSYLSWLKFAVFWKRFQINLLFNFLKRSLKAATNRFHDVENIIQSSFPNLFLYVMLDYIIFQYWKRKRNIRRECCCKKRFSNEFEEFNLRAFEGNQLSDEGS